MYIGHYALVLAEPSSPDAIARICVTAGLTHVDDGGALLVDDSASVYEVAAAVRRVEDAGGRIAHVTELPTGGGEQHRVNAQAITAVIRARDAARRAPEVKHLWHRLAP